MALATVLALIGGAGVSVATPWGSDGQHASNVVRWSTYRVSVVTESTAEIVELRQRPVEYRAQLEGDLTVFRTSHFDDFDGAIRVRSLRLFSGAGRLTHEEGRLRQSLTQPFRIRRKDGRFVDCAFAIGVPAEARKLIRTLLSVAQLPGAIHGSDSRIVVDDTVGTKSLRVHRRPSGWIQLTEPHYVANTAPAAALHSRGTWTTTPSKRDLLGFREIHGEEQLDARVTKLSRSGARQRVSLTLLPTRPMLSPRIGPARGSGYSTPEPLWWRPSEQSTRMALAFQTLRGLRATDVFRLVDQLGTDRQSDKSGTDAFAKLRALVIVDDAAATAVGHRLALADARSPQFGVYGQALISAGTPAAQRVFLREIHHRISDPAGTQRLLAELIGLDHPSVASVRDLQQLASDTGHPSLAAAATLVLGRFAAKLTASSPRASAEIVSTLGHLLLARQDLEGQRLYLGALGNAGLSSGLPYIRPFLAASPVTVRGDAVAALRFIPGSSVDLRLREALAQDPSDDVRAAAVFAISFRPGQDTNIGALVLALRGDPSDRVRRSALRVLWGQRDVQPAIVNIVDEVARRDPSDELRKMASNLMSTDRN